MVEDCNMNNGSFSENSSNVKEEFKHDGYRTGDDKISVSETIVSINDIKLEDNIKNNKIRQFGMSTSVDEIKIEPQKVHAILINDNVKIEHETNVDDIKIEFNDKLLFCDHCSEHYQDYCTKCGMLVHILNRNSLNNTDNSAIEEIPNDILEIRKSAEHVGIYALKVIPEGVKIGPFTGLSITEYPLRLKGDKFILNDDKLRFLNWMQYINPARNIFQQNLLPFQFENSLYYHSNREIQAGEELLVYFRAEYEDSLNEAVEMIFIPPTEEDVKDVYACTFCCLGFSSGAYLVKHNSTCLNRTNGKFSVEEVIQCPFCKIYMDNDEYLQYHEAYCCERNDRQCIPPPLDNQTIERCQISKYSQDKNKTEDLKKYNYKCETCDYKTDKRWRLTNHTKSEHLKEFSYKCDVCEYKTNCKSYFDNHLKTRHLKEFSYKCASCGYQTNCKSNLRSHTKVKHLKEFKYNCEICQLKTNDKTHLKVHMKTKHLKEFSYKCASCAYQTNYVSTLKIHTETQHLKEPNYKCDKCDYKTNNRPHFEYHAKAYHVRKFSYECELCDFKTSHKQNLKCHTKTKHLKEFNHKCEICDFETSKKSNLTRHIKSKHLKEFDYKCDICTFKTNNKADLEMHIKTKHLKEFDYKCGVCEYQTNRRYELRKHIKSKHHVYSSSHV